MKAKYINPFTYFGFKKIFGEEASKPLSQAFEKAEIAKFDSIERDYYTNSLKSYRDLKSVIVSAFDDGKLEGKLEEKFAIAKNAKLLGIKIEDIIKLTGLSSSEIEKL
ncbi:MAG: hypothetical protein U0V72_01875 [Cytophagales bacterium]